MQCPFHVNIKPGCNFCDAQLQGAELIHTPGVGVGQVVVKPTLDNMFSEGWIVDWCNLTQSALIKYKSKKSKKLLLLEI